MARLTFHSYVGISVVSTLVLVCYALYTREQFYPTIQFLVTHKLSLVLLGNMLTCVAVWFARLLKSLFLGNLRDAEVELLFENCKYALTETCLALTIFRAELTPTMLALFLMLLFCKAFHWVSRSRVEHLEQVGVVTTLTHVRLGSLMFILLCIDMIAVMWCGSEVMASGRSVLILFGFEYAVLTISVACSIVRYVLYWIDIASESTWHEKGAYIMLLELTKEGLCFVVYVVFFSLVFVHYGMPLHIIRDVYMSYMSFQRKLAGYIRYRQLTANLNERFPDASTEDIGNAGSTCIICREGMDAGKKIPCGHIFHLDCLRMWLQHQQTCPVCRAEIPRQQIQRPVRAPTVVNGGPGLNVPVLRPEAPGNADAPNPQPQIRPQANDQRNFYHNDLPVPADEIHMPQYSPRNATHYNNPTYGSASGTTSPLNRFPVFMKVVTSPGTDVYERPNRQSRLLRHISQNTLVLVTDSVYASERWFEVARDGFVPAGDLSQEVSLPNVMDGAMRSMLDQEYSLPVEAGISRSLPSLPRERRPPPREFISQHGQSQNHLHHRSDILQQLLDLEVQMSRLADQLQRVRDSVRVALNAEDLVTQTQTLVSSRGDAGQHETEQWLIEQREEDGVANDHSSEKIDDDDGDGVRDRDAVTISSQTEARKQQLRRRYVEMYTSEKRPPVKGDDRDPTGGGTGTSSKRPDTPLRFR